MITGAEIAAARGRLRWSQQQLAEAVGVSREAIARWESGSPIRRGNYARLIDALGVGNSGDENPLAEFTEMELLAELNRRAARNAARPTTARHYLRHPESDPVLLTRLAELASPPGTNAVKREQLSEEIRQNRRTELLNELPPQERAAES